MELSDSEKAQFMNAAREVLRQSIEDAKFWRALIAGNQVTDDGESTTL